MKKAILLGVLLATGAFAQTKVQILVWDVTAHRYLFPTMGGTLKITNGVLDVVFAGIPDRLYSMTVTASADGTYQLPTTAKKIVVLQNGLRQFEGIDYSLVGTKVTPLWPWPADSLIRFDYE
jgi:hypothetical protein